MNNETKKEQIIQKVQSVIEQIRPHLQNDGGDIEFVELTDQDVVHVKLKGACHGCPMAYQTIKHGVEATIKKHVPEVKEVIAINM